MTGHLTDFESCISSCASSTNDEVESDEASFQTANERRRHKKSKRKLRHSPPLDHFLKKPNMNVKN